MAIRTRPVVLVVVAVLLAIVYWQLHASGELDAIVDPDTLRDRVAGMGGWGPLMVVALMTLAILVSPIPSAPIALAAGAAYGHTWGTVYVLVGAEAGALMAFALARLVGFETVHRWFGDRLSIGLIGSQNVLMSLVLVSRLLPFMSFDIVSYAAGLTVLSFWRFAVATFVGTVPASFLLAHFGSEMASGASEWLVFTVLAMGAVTLIPMLVSLLRNRRPGRRRPGEDRDQ